MSPAYRGSSTDPDSRTVRDIGASLLRTVIPVLVGLVVSELLQAGIDVDEGALTSVLDAACIGGYYALLRVLEARVPALGWLLGYRATLRYDA